MSSSAVSSDSVASVQCKRFVGKIAIVTGSSSGIGAKIATRLVQEGASVAIVYHSNKEKAEQIVKQLEQIKSPNAKIDLFQADLSDVSQCKILVDAVINSFHGLHILCSNAGIEHFDPLENISLTDFDRVFHTNVASQLFMVKACVPHLPRGGRISLTSSVSARISVLHHTLYAASKAAVSAMVSNLAPELSNKGITINTIAPGGTQTPMAEEAAAKYTPPALKDLPAETKMEIMCAMKRLAKPEEIASAVAFLVSDDAAYMTGSTLQVDGGFLM